MSLHRLASVTVGVPEVAPVAAYYRDFGLSEVNPSSFATSDGGVQLALQEAPTRRLCGVVIDVDHSDDLDTAASNLGRLGIAASRTPDKLTAIEPVCSIAVTLKVAARATITPAASTPYNGPGRTERPNVRAPAVERGGQVCPRRLGHVVLGSTDEETTRRFFTEGLGLMTSDVVPGLATFLRCSTDHHNILVQSAPVNFLHHTAWEVDDIDEVGRGATAMLEGHPERHVWGLGRHHIGSNFFWYLRDPAGNFSEYYSDLDEITDEQLWTPEVFEGSQGLYSWGPRVPPSFIHPEDLADLMISGHTAG